MLNSLECLKPSRREKLMTMEQRGATEGERAAARNLLNKLYPDWDISDEQLLRELGIEI